MIEISLSKKLTKDRIVIQGRNDYLIEAEKQLRGKKVYQEVRNSENKLSKLAEMSNKMLSTLEKRGYITEKQLNFLNFISFSKFIKVCIVSQDGQIFPIAVHLQKNCSEFLDYHLKPLMQRGGRTLKSG